MQWIRRLTGAALLVSVVVVLAAGCSSDDEPTTSTQTSGQSGSVAQRTGSPTAAAPSMPFAPVVAVSELAVGQNRFGLGIIDNATGQPLPDAEVHFRFFTLQGNQGTLRFESDPTFVAPARDAGVSGIIEHRHADGTNHPHANVEADVGVYVSQVQFDQAGDWGVEATFRAPDGREGTVTAPFKVATESQTPAVGAAAPRTKNLTLRDSPDLTKISSAIEPNPALYQTTVADAIAAGKPALVAFVTPGYCATRFCGPTYELVNQLLPAYGDKAALIHIEVWKDPINKVPADALREWRLTTEPYIFVVDRYGIITDKFEGPVSLVELDAAMKKVTATS